MPADSGKAVNAESPPKKLSKSFGGYRKNADFCPPFRRKGRKRKKDSPTVCAVVFISSEFIDILGNSSERM